MHLSAYSRSALALAGLCAVALATGCGPGTGSAPRPADLLLGPTELPSDFVRATASGVPVLSCPPLDQALVTTGDQASVSYSGRLSGVAERLTRARDTGSAEAVLRAVDASLGHCPGRSTATRAPGGLLTGRTFDVTPLDRLEGIGDESVVARVAEGNGLAVGSTDVLVIRKGADVVELWVRNWTFAPRSDLSATDLARKAVARLG
ncbi:hypothetical protein [Kitasatospora sp. NPDC094011]|uniref:hypothetical protein n=1 Tax=Kitasatospora sp. NPDC094011 TaxID=3364090 RepID=UPI003819104C